jgi:alkanesulfonate monooxygenase
MPLMPLRFHWRLLQRGESGGGSVERVAPEAALPALAEQTAFCREAEESGIDSVLVDVNLGKPDPLLLALPLALATRRLKFLVAHRPGVMSPALFVQQVNTFAVLTGGRITLNIVAGHSPAEQRSYGDGLAHDERYRRMDEFLAICRRLWAGEGPVSFAGDHYRIEEGKLNTPFVSPASAAPAAPEIYLGGSSPQARTVAARHASCWMRFADAPEAVARDLAAGPRAPEVGLRLSLVVRPSREEAAAAARRLVETQNEPRGAEPRNGEAKRRNEAAFVQASDSLSMQATRALAAEREWLTPSLWAGAVPIHGAPSLALVGTPETVAGDLLEYARVGISQFILSGWPKREEMIRFGTEVLPLVRRAEGAAAAERA